MVSANSIRDTRPGFSTAALNPRKRPTTKGLEITLEPRRSASTAIVNTTMHFYSTHAHTQTHTVKHTHARSQSSAYTHNESRTHHFLSLNTRSSFSVTLWCPNSLDKVHQDLILDCAI